MKNYVLIDNQIIEQPNLIKWLAWFKSANRTIEKTQIGQVTISTVFLGTEYGIGHDGKPLLFETMVFGGTYDGYQTRASCLEHAKIQHEEAVKLHLRCWTSK
jgi:hypothetical protein